MRPDGRRRNITERDCTPRPLGGASGQAPSVAGGNRLREVVGFHCQQTVEKYLKALLTFYQVEFPKTHEIERLLVLVSGANREAADALTGAKCISFPGDQPIPTRIEGEIARRLSRRKR